MVRSQTPKPKREARPPDAAGTTSFPLSAARTCGVLVAATALTWFARHLADDTMYVFLLGAIAVAGWKDGWKSAALAAVLAAGVIDVLFIEPIGGLKPGTLAGVTQLVGFALVALLIVAMTHALRESEHRAAHHARNAERALVAAEDLVKERETFLRTLSHEVRTPINAILGYADLLEIGAGGPINPVQTQYVRRLQLAARHLQTVANGALEIARADAGNRPLDRRRIRVAPCIEMALTMVAPQAAEKHLAIHVDRSDAELAFLADADCVQQILVNLLGNAVKFTPPGGTIRVETGFSPVARLTAGRIVKPVYVRVTDSGPGVAAADQDRIFEPFQRGDQHGGVAASGGAGLGLAISRRLARLMEGDIVLDSPARAGASFVLYLPSRADSTMRQWAAAG